MSQYIILFSIITILLCIVVLWLLSGRTKRENLSNENGEDVVEKQVQCPACSRWKLMMPLTVEASEKPSLDYTMGMHVPQQIVMEKHWYKCAFCGHEWQEDFQLGIR